MDLIKKLKSSLTPETWEDRWNYEVVVGNRHRGFNTREEAEEYVERLKNPEIREMSKCR